MNLRDEPGGGPYRRPLLPAWVRRAGRRARRRRALGPRLGRYAPRSTVARPVHEPQRSCVAAIDFHTHLGRWLSADGSWMEEPEDLLALMDECNIETCVNLDGRWDSELEANLDRYDRAFPGRFATFCHLDWSLLGRSGTTTALVRSLERSAACGARGLKVWKDLGLYVRDQRGLVLPDDPRLDDVWEAAAQMGLPVLIHVADPLAYFLPVDRFNERLEDLLRNPRNSQVQLGIEVFHRLLDAFEHLVASHPTTTFVGAHVGCHPEDLGWVSRMLDDYPNVSIDTAGRVADLGRQPRAAARLFERHADRVLFGSDDFPLDASGYRSWFRLLETGDEAFDYSGDPVPPTGRWTVSGLDLSRDVLERVYAANASRLLEGVRPHPAGDRG